MLTDERCKQVGLPNSPTLLQQCAIESVNEPRVCDDGWHCDPECPHLHHHDDDGMCKKYGIKLEWYDYYIALCRAEYDFANDNGGAGGTI